MKMAESRQQSQLYRTALEPWRIVGTLPLDLESLTSVTRYFICRPSAKLSPPNNLNS